MVGFRNRRRNRVGQDVSSKATSLVDAFFGWQLTGRGCRSLKNLPKGVYCRLQSGSNGIAQLCMDLERNFHNDDVGQCLDVLRTVSRAICELTSAQHRANREAFLLFGGDALLLRVLCAPPATGLGVQFSGGRQEARGLGFGDEEDITLWNARNECLGILRELCFTTSFYSETLTSNVDLLKQLCSFMRRWEVFDNAVGLAEEILAVREETLDLRKIPSLPGLVRGLSSRQLAFFCRVLAMVVFEPEDRLNKVGLDKSDKCGATDDVLGPPCPMASGSSAGSGNANCSGNGPGTSSGAGGSLGSSGLPVTGSGSGNPGGNGAVGGAGGMPGRPSDELTNSDVNHQVLLEIPEFLPRLVKLLNMRTLPYNSRELADVAVEMLQPLLATHTQTSATLEQADEAGGIPVGHEGGLLEGPSMAALLEALRLPDDPSGAREGPNVRFVVGWTQGDGEGPGGREPWEEAEGPAGTTVAVGAGGSGQAGEACVLQWQVEVLFVLCALLGGREKERVQDRLAELGLVNALNAIFDKLDWTVPVPPPPEPHGIHGPGCACNPDSALKIQYLRLVHNFCDRDGSNAANKRLLLEHSSNSTARTQPSRPLLFGDGDELRPSSDSQLLLDVALGTLQPLQAESDLATGREGDLLFGYPAATRAADAGAGASRAASSPAVKKRVPPPKDVGLMGKVLHVLMDEPEDSVYRFWLASCVEAFLRGSDPHNQAYVAGRGLMEHLVGTITKGGFKCAAALQINFDLLGELVKFNPGLVARLDELLTPDKFERLIEVTVTHLVDSNVFLRSVVLSLEYFAHGAPSHASPSFPLPSSPIPPPSPPRAALARHLSLASPASPSSASLAVASPRSDAHKGFSFSTAAGVVSTSGGNAFSSSLGGTLAPGSPGATESPASLASPVSGSEAYLAAFTHRMGRNGMDIWKLSAFISGNTLRLLRDLMVAVNRGEINQDNICVLNTALIYFIFAERKGHLVATLASLRQFEAGRGSGSNGAGPTSVTRNFRGLLDYWRDYYMYRRSRDCVSLVYSTNIPFSEWLHIVDTLCGGPESPTSLSYSPLSQCATLTASTEPPPRRT